MKIATFWKWKLLQTENETFTNRNMKLATQKTEIATTEMWKFLKGNMKITWRAGGVECWEGDVQVKSVLAEKEKNYNLHH